MAADEEPADVVASSPPLGPHPDHSPSNASSPLTEVEDKDGEPDEMDLDGPVHNSSSLSNVNLDDEDDNGSRAARSHSGSDNDESALSEVEADINDSEAETERLYDTPTKAKNIKDGVDAESSPESVTSPTKRLAQTRGDRTFQASPSKLKQQLHADSEADEDEEDEDALSDAEDEENNEADGEEEAAADDREATRSSRRRSLAAKEQAKKLGQSPSLGSKTTKEDANGDKEETPVPTPALLRSQRSNSDTRKRKRSPTTDPSESDQPLRKRIGSGSGGAGRDATTSIAEDIDGEKASAKRSNGVTDDDAAETGADEKAEGDNSAEGTNSDTFRARRSKRGSAKKRNNSDDGDDDANEDQNDDGLEDGDLATAEEDAVGHGDDEPIDGDIDEEAEAAHRNEEECTTHPNDETTVLKTITRDNADNLIATVERKKQALENLHAIEKQFASFRDKFVPLFLFFPRYARDTRY